MRDLVVAVQYTSGKAPLHKVKLRMSLAPRGSGRREDIDLNRRNWITAAAALAGMPLANGLAGAAGLRSLAASPRMPVLFLGHGSPMNAIQDNEFRRSWQALGAEFGKNWPKPQVILCV